MSEKKVKEKKEKTKINPMMLMMLLMLVIVVALGAGLGYLILNSKKSGAETTKVVVVSSVPEIPALTYALTKDFTVNLTDTDSKRYVKLNVTLAFTSAKLEEELKTADPFIRDTINSVLREKKAADFTSKGTEDLKKEFMTRINPYLKAGKISDVYFNDILVQ